MLVRYQMKRRRTGKKVYKKKLRESLYFNELSTVFFFEWMAKKIESTVQNQLKFLPSFFLEILNKNSVSLLTNREKKFIASKRIV